MTRISWTISLTKCVPGNSQLESRAERNHSNEYGLFSAVANGIQHISQVADSVNLISLCSISASALESFIEIGIENGERASFDHVSSYKMQLNEWIAIHLVDINRIG